MNPELICNEVSLKLFRNCNSIILQYVTPLPELPFEKELLRKTDAILFDLWQCSYSSFSFKILQEKIPETCKIRLTFEKNWKICWRNGGLRVSIMEQDALLARGPVTGQFLVERHFQMP